MYMAQNATIHVLSISSHSEMMHLLESGRIQYASPGLIMSYRSAAYFERHVLTNNPGLTINVVCLGLIAFLEKSQGKNERRESSYNVVFVST
jgi:hypothetical protein